jgi:drug/metabolite transporter (DMT)-like permease
MRAMQDDTARRRDVVLVVLASFAFASAGPLGKIAVVVPAVAVAAARTGVASVLLALAAPRALVSALRSLTPRRRLGVVLAGALLAAHFALFLSGLAATSLAAAVALVSLEPLAVVLAAFVAFGIRPTRREIAGLVLATAGAFVVASGAGVGEHRLAGDVMVVACVLLYGAYVAAARGLRDAMPAVPYAAAVYGASSLMLAPIAIVACASSAPPSPPRAAILAIVALGVVPTAIGHTLVQTAARRAPPVLVALVSPGETVGSLAIGAFMMGTPPTATEGAGAFLILAGATLAVTSRAAVT